MRVHFHRTEDKCVGRKRFAKMEINFLSFTSRVDAALICGLRFVFAGTQQPEGRHHRYVSLPLCDTQCVLMAFVFHGKVPTVFRLKMVQGDSKIVQQKIEKF